MKELLYVIKRLQKEFNCEVNINCAEEEEEIAIRLRRGTYEVGRTFPFIEIEQMKNFNEETTAPELLSRTIKYNDGPLLTHFIEWVRTTEMGK